MIITYLDYKLEQSEHAPSRFDLIRKTIRTKRESEETYETDDIVGHGYLLENAIENIIYLEIKKKNEILTLKEFLNEFRKEKELVLNELKEVLTIKN